MFRIVLILALLLSLFGCGGGAQQGTSTGERYQAAVAESIYATSLARCTMHNSAQTAERCTLGELPLIGQAHPQPSVQDIMNQTVVSDPWMSTRFRQVLEKLPNEILTLFSSVTAVVIGSDIRPSGYSTITGAIYLDPQYLWLLAEERATISTAPSFRDNFGKELKFRMWGFYLTTANKPAWDYWSLESTVASRDLSSIVAPFASVLLHELAHARDAMPTSGFALAQKNLTLVGLIDENEAKGLYQFFDKRTPLQSTLLKDLAQVAFKGKKASEAQLAVTTSMVSNAFAAEGASDFYNYSDALEDAAMLFEEVMMRYYFGVERAVIALDWPSTESSNCSNTLVQWGEYRRVSNPAVTARAQVVVQQILGTNDVSRYFSTLRQSANVSSGTSVCSLIYN